METKNYRSGDDKIAESKRTLYIGQILYLLGSKTKIEILDKPECHAPLIKILDRSKHSKYKVGDVMRMTRQFLYPEQRSG